MSKFKEKSRIQDLFQKSYTNKIELMASGSFFGDAANPKVMLQVGLHGDVGDIEMQELLFTSKGATPGLVLVEWNVRGAKPGSAGMWDCHARLGGATGTLLTPLECPALTSGVNQGCNAASLMMHITALASGYFENVWLWGSDHMIDDPDLVDANNTSTLKSPYKNVVLFAGDSMSQGLKERRAIVWCLYSPHLLA